MKQGAGLGDTDFYYGSLCSPETVRSQSVVRLFFSVELLVRSEEPTFKQNKCEYISIRVSSRI